MIVESVERMRFAEPEMQKRHPEKRGIRRAAAGAREVNENIDWQTPKRIACGMIWLSIEQEWRE
jgi:hypothetical protein